MVEKKLGSIDHIAIKVKDLKLAIDFYCGTIGGEVISEFDDWAFISFENIKLALIASENHPAHIAIEVFSEEDLEKMGLKQYKHRDGSRSCYDKDPDGNFVEYIFYKKTNFT